MTNNIKGYQNNPQLQTLNAPEGWQGTPVDKEGRFLNLNHPFIADWFAVFRWQLQKNPFKKEKKAEVWTPEIFRDDAWLSGNDDVIVWLGHSTFYIRLNGVRLIIDPVFFDIPFVKRKAEFPVNVGKLRNLDYILVSHDHRDHLDQQSLRLLSQQNAAARYLTGLNMKQIINRFTGSDNMEEAGWYQEYNITSHPIKITFIPSRHWSKRGLYDTNKRLWGGFVIEAKSKRILFGGDSGYDTHYSQLAHVFKKFNYAILGIGAYEPAWFMSPNHQSPTDALRGFGELNAEYLIPMHHSTFDLSDEPLSRPIKNLLAAAKDLRAEDKLIILDIGRSLKI